MNIAQKQKELQWERHDNFVRCLEGSKKLEAIAVAIRDEDSAFHERLLTAVCEYRHYSRKSDSGTLITFLPPGIIFSPKLDCLNVRLHNDEILMLISFLACECFLVAKQEGK